MRFPTRDGVVDIVVRDSRSASLIGEYYNAIDGFLKTGDVRFLHYFRGRSVRSGKISYPFIVDPDLLETLADAGEFTFDSIYDDDPQG